MDERAGKPDNINFIHCLCPVIREGEKKRAEDRREVDSLAELRTLMSKLTFGVSQLVLLQNIDFILDIDW